MLWCISVIEYITDFSSTPSTSALPFSRLLRQAGNHCSRILIRYHTVKHEYIYKRVWFKGKLLRPKHSVPFIRTYMMGSIGYKKYFKMSYCKALSLNFPLFFLICFPLIKYFYCECMCVSGQTHVRVQYLFQKKKKKKNLNFLPSRHYTPKKMQ